MDEKCKGMLQKIAAFLFLWYLILGKKENLCIQISGVERIGAQKMENCKNIYSVQNSVKNLTGWLRMTAFLLVFSLLAVGTEHIFPKVIRESAGKTIDEGKGPEKTVLLSDSDVLLPEKAAAFTDSSRGGENGTETGTASCEAGTVTSAEAVINTAPSAPGMAETVPAENITAEAVPVPDWTADMEITELAAEKHTGDGDKILFPETPSAGEPQEDTITESPVGTADSVGGFLVDKSGMICGIADAGIAVSDGRMNLPCEKCRGIRAGAFLEAPDGIVEVYLPENITSIESGAFLGLTGVEWYDADPDNSVYQTEDGVLFSENGTCILAFPPGRIGIYPVPAQVKTFARDAFADARIDKLITVECGLTDMGNLPENIVIM